MLKVEQVSCQKGFTLLFSNLSFYLNSGDIGRVKGANGTGKTSLLKIIAGISSFEGDILLHSFTHDSIEYQKNVLYLGHQSLVHNQLTALENLAYLYTLTTEDTTANSADHTQQLTQALGEVGLKAYVHERAYKLSAGQKRRILLALLFVSNVGVWLLDEPFTALDVDMVARIEKRIQEFCSEGGICVFTTHQATSLVATDISL